MVVSAEELVVRVPEIREVWRGTECSQLDHGRESIEVEEKAMR